MASGSELLTTLLFKISADSAALKQGLDRANSDVQKFSQGINKLKSVIAGAFTVTAILGAGKAIFDFASEIDGVISKLDDLGQSIDLALNAGKAKAIADVFGTDIDGVIKAANATAVQFGISMTEALTYIQQGIALAGSDTTKYLKSLEQQAAAFNESGGEADEYFAIVTNGYRNSTQWENELKIGRSENVKAFSELTSQFNEGQIIQQRLIDTSAELNKIWGEMFDGTGDKVDELKVKLNEVAIASLNGIAVGFKTIGGYFKSLYDNSMLFRGVLELIKLNFTGLWETVKVVFNNIVNGFTTIGNLIKAVFTADFKSIPSIIGNFFKQTFEDVKGAVGTFATQAKDSFNNTFNHNPVEIISEPKAVEQGINAAKNFHKGFKSVEAEKKKDLTPDINATGTLTTVVTPDFTKSIESIAKYRKEQEATNLAIAESNRLYAEMQSYEDIITGIADAASQSITALGQSVLSSNSDSQKSFKDLGKSFAMTIKKIIASSLAASIAGAIKSAMLSSFNPVVGLALAGVATAGVNALFSQLPNFATGGRTKNPFFIAGESQGRGELVMNTAGSSRIYNHSQTKSMMNNNSLQRIEVVGTIGNDAIYLANKEAGRRRGEN